MSDFASWAPSAAVLILAYLLGAIPFGLILTRLAGAGDIRTIGSGNIGATNVLRTGRKGLAAATLLLDAAKGFVAVLAAGMVAPGLAPLAGLAAFLGHCYPVWLGFKGGKGVATALGILVAVSWPIAAIAAAVWLAALALFRFSSLGSLAATASAPVAALVLGEQHLLPLLVPLALLIAWKHRANIARLLAGTEPRVGTKTRA